MFEVKLFDKKRQEIFVKKIWGQKTLKNFLFKIKYSKKIKLITVTDNSYLYD